MNDCINCGYGKGLHHYKTMQCPKCGEAPIGEKQEWLSTVYKEKCNSSYSLASVKKALNFAMDELKELANECKKLKSDQLDIVNWLNELIPFGREQYPGDDGLFCEAEKLYERLTGKKWEDISK